MADPKKLADSLKYQMELENALKPATVNPTIQAQGDERRFMSGITASPWYSEFQKQYGEAPDLSKNADYDYRKAWAAGIRPEPDPFDQNRLHWPSSAPSGEMLKAENHPTAWKEYFMRATGQNPDAVGATQADWEAMQGNQ